MNHAKEQKREDKKTIVKEVAILSSAGYVSQTILAVRGFWVAALLGPSVYGVWQILKIFINAAPLLGLGTPHAMMREVPFNKGKNQEGYNEAIIQSTFTLGFLTSLVLGVIVFVWSFTSISTAYHMEVRIAVLAFIGGYVLYFSRSYLRATNNMITLSKLNLVDAVLNTTIGLVLLIQYGLKGLIVGLIVTQVALFFYFQLKRYLSFGMHRETIARLLRVGLPILASTFGQFWMFRIDSVIVFLMLGATHTGYYGLAAFIILSAQYIPESIAVVLMPKLLHKYGETREKKDVEHFFKRPIEILSIGMPFLLGILYINLALPIHYFLPNYTPAIPTIKILTAALYFTSIMAVPMSILSAFNEQRKAMFLIMGALLFGATLDVMVIRLGHGIEGVSLATGLTFFLVSLLSIIYTLQTFRRDLHGILQELVKIYSPFVIMIVVLKLVTYIASGEENDLVQNCIRTFAYCGILFLIFFKPIRNWRLTHIKLLP